MTKKRKSISRSEREAWMALVLSEARMARQVARVAAGFEVEGGVLLHHYTNVMLRMKLVAEFGLDLDDLGERGDELLREAESATRKDRERAESESKAMDDVLDAAMQILKKHREEGN